MRRFAMRGLGVDDGGLYGQTRLASGDHDARRLLLEEGNS